MTTPKLAQAIGVLVAAYPRASWPDETVAVYARVLADLDVDRLADAILRLIKISVFPPSIAEIRTAVAEDVLGLPTEAEAWEMVTGARPATEWPDEVRRALAGVGGSWALKTSERPEMLRRQFGLDYSSHRRQAIERAAAGEGLAIEGQQALASG